MKKITKIFVSTTTALVMVFSPFTAIMPDITEAASVSPEFVPGAANKTCSNFEREGQNWTEFKIDPNADGVYSDGTLTVTILNTTDDKTFDFTSNIGVDSVFVKAGAAGSYLYRYDPPAEITGDTALTSPGASGNQISHISFCYDADPTYTIAGKKFNDENCDGEWNHGEELLSRWEMTLEGPNQLSKSTFTV